MHMKTSTRLKFINILNINRMENFKDFFFLTHNKLLNVVKLDNSPKILGIPSIQNLIFFLKNYNNKKKNM